LTRDAHGYIKNTNPQTLNLYAYCGNNPMNKVDPSGHKMVKDGNQYSYLKDMAEDDPDEGNRQWAQDQLDRGLYYHEVDDSTFSTINVSNGYISPTPGSNGYLTVPIVGKCLLGLNTNIDLATGEVYPSVDYGLVAGSYVTYTYGKCEPGTTTNAAFYFAGGGAVGIDNNSCTFGFGGGGGIYRTKTFRPINPRKY
jgi:hypothetical protein